MLERPQQAKELRLIANALREIANKLERMPADKIDPTIDDQLDRIASNLHEMVHHPENWPRPASFYDLMAEAEACGEEPVEGAIRRHRSGVTSVKHEASDGKRQAAQLAAKMTALGLSVFEPDPINAIEARLAGQQWPPRAH
jgi:hypothetical protein